MDFIIYKRILSALCLLISSEISSDFFVVAFNPENICEKVIITKIDMPNKSPQFVMYSSAGEKLEELFFAKVTDNTISIMYTSTDTETTELEIEGFCADIIIVPNPYHP